MPINNATVNPNNKCGPVNLSVAGKLIHLNNHHHNRKNPTLPVEGNMDIIAMRPDIEGNASENNLPVNLDKVDPITIDESH